MINNIANRVMLLGKWERNRCRGSSVMYRAACDCTGKDCDITIDLEYDKDLSIIELTFYKDTHFYDRIQDPDTSIDKIRNILYKLKKAMRLILTGNLEVESSFIFQGEDQVNSFIDALTEGRDYVIKDINNGEK
jgi:hypothetical protein